MSFEKELEAALVDRYHGVICVTFEDFANQNLKLETSQIRSWVRAKDTVCTLPNGRVGVIVRDLWRISDLVSVAHRISRRFEEQEGERRLAAPSIRVVPLWQVDYDVSRMLDELDHGFELSITDRSSSL